MNAMVLRNTSRNEPGLLLAGVLALLIHIVFIVFMFFGLNWKSQPPEGLVVDLWQDWSHPTQPAIKQPSVKKEPEQAEPVQQHKPTQQAVQKKSPPAKIASPSPAKKPDIVRKKKSEKPEPVTEKQPLQERQRKHELEKQRGHELEKQKEKAEIAEAQRLQREQELQQQREREALAAQQAAERAQILDEIAKYRAMILAKVRSRIVTPPDLPGNPMTEFGVTMLPGGDILDVQLRQSSGYASFDSAVERAIFLSQPLPLPANPALFREFRNLNIMVHYHE